MKKTILKMISLSFLCSGAAHADFSAVCGAGRENGPESAQISLLSEELGDRVFLDGHPVPENSFGVKPATDQWIVTIAGDSGGSGRKFIFYVAKEIVQEFTVDLRGPQKKVGEPLPCEWKYSSVVSEN